jgi:hypothetical protein
MAFTSLFKSLRAHLLAGGLAVAGVVGVGSPSRAQQVIWEDDFGTGQSVGRSRWSVSGDEAFIPQQHTRFGAAPKLMTDSANGTTFVRLPLNSYNPAPGRAGQVFQGTEMKSRAEWSMGPGLQWEARVRGTKVPKGIVYAFFTFRRSYAEQEEIDFEFLSNWINSSDAYTRTKVWTNIWNKGRPQQGNACCRASTRRTGTPTPSVGLRAALSGSSTALLRTETETVPDEQMGVIFNIWAAQRLGHGC